MAKKLMLVFVAMLVLVMTFGLLASTVAAQPTAKVKVLIGFSHQPGPSEQALVHRAGGTIKHTYHIVPAIAATVPETAIAGLRANPNVTHVEEDGLVQAVDLELDNSWGVKRIGAGTVHGYNKGTGVRVAIIDTGIDWNHPDLGANYKGGHDFVNSDNDPMDDNGHGTHVAGIAAAEDDDSGVVGVAPEAALYALKVLDSEGSGYWSDIIAAIQWSVDNGMQVINMSLGASRAPSDLQTACDNAYSAGILLVAAAGNSGNRWGYGNNVIYPARYDSVIAVAATDGTDTRASWSSAGPAVELAAPGVGVYSTYWDNTYATKSGTSMASPHVAGTAALVMVAYPSWTNAQVRTQLQDTADDLGPAGKDNLYGYGLVDADEAAPMTNTPLSVAITDPANGATISGTYRVTVSASDSGGTIAKVELSIDSAAYIDITATFNGASCYYDWDTTEVADGPHTIKAVATDSEDQTASDTIGVTVDNTAPVVNVVEPSEGATVSGTITIKASVSETNVDKVEYQIDTGNFAPMTYNENSGSWEADWESTTVVNGAHSLTVQVTDKAGNSASDTNNFAVDNPVQTMHVKSLSLALKTAGINTSAQATATVFDAKGNPVEGATVSGHWEGATSDSDSGVTDVNGQVTLQSDKVKRASSGTIFTFVIDNVTKDGWTYDASANGDFNGDEASGDTSSSITVP